MAGRWVCAPGARILVSSAPRRRPADPLKKTVPAAQPSRPETGGVRPQPLLAESTISDARRHRRGPLIRGPGEKSADPASTEAPAPLPCRRSEDSGVCSASPKEALDDCDRPTRGLACNGAGGKSERRAVRRPLVVGACCRRLGWPPPSHRACSHNATRRGGGGVDLT